MSGWNARTGMIDPYIVTPEATRKACLYVRGPFCQPALRAVFLWISAVLSYGSPLFYHPTLKLRVTRG